MAPAAADHGPSNVAKFYNLKTLQIAPLGLTVTSLTSWHTVPFVKQHKGVLLPPCCLFCDLYVVVKQHKGILLPPCCLFCDLFVVISCNRGHINCTPWRIVAGGGDEF